MTPPIDIIGSKFSTRLIALGEQVAVSYQELYHSAGHEFVDHVLEHHRLTKSFPTRLGCYLVAQEQDMRHPTFSRQLHLFRESTVRRLPNLLKTNGGWILFAKILAWIEGFESQIYCQIPNQKV